MHARGADKSFDKLKSILRVETFCVKNTDCDKLTPTLKLEYDKYAELIFRGKDHNCALIEPNLQINCEHKGLKTFHKLGRIMANS